jgi:hypothetical protein
MAAARLARPALERERCRQRRRCLDVADFACRDARRLGQRPLRGIADPASAAGSDTGRRERRSVCTGAPAGRLNSVPSATSSVHRSRSHAAFQPRQLEKRRREPVRAASTVILAGRGLFQTTCLAVAVSTVAIGSADGLPPVRRAVRDERCCSSCPAGSKSKVSQPSAWTWPARKLRPPASSATSTPADAGPSLRSEPGARIGTAPAPMSATPTGQPGQHAWRRGKTDRFHHEASFGACRTGFCSATATSARDGEANERCNPIQAAERSHVVRRLEHGVAISATAAIRPVRLCL